VKENLMVFVKENLMVFVKENLMVFVKENLMVFVVGVCPNQFPDSIYWQVVLLQHLFLCRKMLLQVLQRILYLF
jgi:hypothetical protein